MQKNCRKSNRNAFVIMPFKKPISGYYEAVFKPALISAGYDVHRADEIYRPNVIIRDIQQLVVEADLILCELTGRNPNVLYELGLAHALGKPAILVSSNKKDVPFDLRHIRYIEYDTTAVGWEKKLKNDISRFAKSVALSEEPCFESLIPQKIGIGEIIAYHPNGSQGDHSFLGRSQRIDMMSITLRGLLEYKAALQEAILAKKANIRLLILNPESAFLIERGKQEGGQRRVNRDNF